MGEALSRDVTKLACGCHGEWNGERWQVAASSFLCDHKQGDPVDGAPPLTRSVSDHADIVRNAVLDSNIYGEHDALCAALFDANRDRRDEACNCSVRRRNDALSALDALVAERDEARRNEKAMRERYDDKYINWKGAAAERDEWKATAEQWMESFAQAAERGDAAHRRREEAEARLGKLEEAFSMLRDAWNAHMETCAQHAALPTLVGPTRDDIEQPHKTQDGGS